MAKPRLSTGRIPFQLGIDAVAAGVPIVNACATLTQRPKPLALLSQQTKPIAAITLGVRIATLFQQPRPLAILTMQTKPIASIAQRPC